MTELENREERFEVNDDSKAEWCLRKIREAEADRAMWKKHYEEQMKRVDESTDATVAYFSAALEEYFDSVPHKTTKTQESYVLPHGKLIRKKQLPKYDIDEETLVNWLRTNSMNEYVKVKETADWANLKKVVYIAPDITGETAIVTDDGEIVSGIKVTMRPDVFKVETGDEE